MSTWISVKDKLPTLPKDESKAWSRSEVVLIWTKEGVCDCRLEFDGSGDPFKWEGAGLSVDYWGDGDCVSFQLNEVTHWMPLPESPK